MKRSEINTIIRDSLSFMREHRLLLPPSQLGWDITDFGSGHFAACGLLLFTIGNGTFAARNGG